MRCAKAAVAVWNCAHNASCTTISATEATCRPPTTFTALSMVIIGCLKVSHCSWIILQGNKQWQRSKGDIDKSIDHLTHTHTSVLRPSDFVWDYPGELLPEPIRILLKQKTVSGSNIAEPYANLHLAQTDTATMPAPHHSVFYRPDALVATQPTVSKHWGH